VILPDVNVLVHASGRTRQSTRNAGCGLESVVRGDMAYGMSPQALGAVVRIVTHPRIFVPPTPLRKLWPSRICWWNSPTARRSNPARATGEIFCGLCRRARASGNLVPDAWFAALAIESGCEWITLDRDYARFGGLRWREPF